MPSKQAIKNFHVLAPLEKNDDNYKDLKVSITYGSIICMCEDVLPIDEKKWLVPVWII